MLRALFLATLALHAAAFTMPAAGAARCAVTTPAASPILMGAKKAPPKKVAKKVVKKPVKKVVKKVVKKSVPKKVVKKVVQKKKVVKKVDPKNKGVATGFTLYNVFG